MQNSIISEGKTTNEAIENGLKKLGNKSIGRRKEKFF